jgi:hypothetical protein
VAVVNKGQVIAEALAADADAVTTEGIAAAGVLQELLLIERPIVLLLSSHNASNFNVQWEPLKRRMIEERISQMHLPVDQYRPAEPRGG